MYLTVDEIKYFEYIFRTPMANHMSKYITSRHKLEHNYMADPYSDANEYFMNASSAQVQETWILLLFCKHLKLNIKHRGWLL